MDKNLRWQRIVILAVVAVCHLWAFYPAGPEDQAGPRPQGRRAPRAARPDRRRPAARDRDDDGAAAGGRWKRRAWSASPSPASTRPGSGSTACRRARTRRSGEMAAEMETTLQPRVRGRRAYTLRDEAEHRSCSCARTRSTQALQTIERRVNELGVAEPIVARHGAAGDQIMVQLPGVTDVQRAKEIIRSTALLELKLVEDGPGADEASAAAGPRRQCCRRNMEVVPGVSDAARRATAPRRSTTWCARSPAVTGRDLRNAQAVARREQPAGGQLLAQQGRGAQVRQGHRREHRPAAGHRPRRPRAVGAAHRGPHQRRGPHHRARFTQQEVAGPVARAALGRAAGVADLPRGAHGRPVARRRLDPRRRHGVARSASRWSSLFMLFYYKLSGINADRVDRRQPDHPARR